MGCWVDTIRRGVGATELELADAPDGEFILRAKWKTKAGEKVHEHLFSREHVFGRTAAGNPLAFRVQKRACDYAKDFMREILAQRGAL
jgi:hypothetical protein